LVPPEPPRKKFKEQGSFFRKEVKRIIEMTKAQRKKFRIRIKLKNFLLVSDID
jgi:hypothetical protein